MHLTNIQDTIVALATAQGVGAIAVIRLSGDNAIDITNQVFKGKDLTKVDSHTIHFGTIRDENDHIVDEVLISIFKGPNSFTKENVIEISTHGSPYIVQRVIKLLLSKGARLAKAGEFTQRAFLNGQFDLAQAEAVADLISSDSEASHSAAINQMRGGFSKEIKALREKLIHFASMIELELDFGEEDVEFANRSDLKDLINNLLNVINPLLQSFDFGNAIKEGIPTVIAGKPNAGKSTLLNQLLNEEKAIVSPIAGTTRDVIEDEMILEGIKFRFIDTAGLRQTEDVVEAIGVERTKEKISQSSLIIYLFDVNTTSFEELATEINEIKAEEKPYIIVGNKIDQNSDLSTFQAIEENILFISAATSENLSDFKTAILKAVNADNFKTGDTVVTNLRHYESLMHTKNSLLDVINGLDNGVTGDFLAMDIRQSLHYLGEITGTISTEDLLDNIFSKFCIGK